MGRATTRITELAGAGRKRGGKGPKGEESHERVLKLSKIRPYGKLGNWVNMEKP